MKPSRRGVIALAASSLGLLGLGAWFVLRVPSSSFSTKASGAASDQSARSTYSTPVRANRSSLESPSAPRAAPSPAEKLAERLLELWRGAPGDSDEASRTAAELLSLGEAAATPLLAVLAREPRGLPRDRLFDLLRQVPGNAAESGLIAEALATDAGVSRALAIEALGERGTETALHALNHVARTDPQVLAQPFLTTTVPNVNDASTELPDEVLFTPRMKAMAAMAASGNARAIPMLVAVLGEEPDQALRMEAATALGRLRGDISTVEALIAAALGDRSPWVRLAALHSLSGVLDPALLEPLSRISAGDSHPGVRLLASRVLAQLRRELG
jgi:hypothetical protein